MLAERCAALEETDAVQSERIHVSERALGRRCRLERLRRRHGPAKKLGRPEEIGEEHKVVKTPDAMGASRLEAVGRLQLGREVEVAWEHPQHKLVLGICVSCPSRDDTHPEGKDEGKLVPCSVIQTCGMAEPVRLDKEREELVAEMRWQVLGEVRWEALPSALHRTPNLPRLPYPQVLYSLETPGYQSVGSPGGREGPHQPSRSWRQGVGERW